jgi:hypothetical protein
LEVLEINHKKNMINSVQNRHLILWLLENLMVC